MNHDFILVIVVLELVFAFYIGFICIIFSINLLRAIKQHPEVNATLTNGEFPPSRPSQFRNSSSFSLLPNMETDYNAMSDRRRVMSAEGSEMDFETQLEPEAAENQTMSVLQTFTSYIRLW
jgi:hypothetical protein